MAKDDQPHYGLDEYIYNSTSGDVPPHKYAIYREIRDKFAEAGYKDVSLTPVYRRIKELAESGKLEEADQNDKLAPTQRGKGYRTTDAGKEDAEKIAQQYERMLKDLDRTDFEY